MTVHCRVQGCTSTSTATATAPRCTQLTSGGKYIYQGQWIRCNCPECSPPGAPSPQPWAWHAENIHVVPGRAAAWPACNTLVRELQRETTSH